MSKVLKSGRGDAAPRKHGLLAAAVSAGVVSLGLTPASSNAQTAPDPLPYEVNWTRAAGDIGNWTDAANWTAFQGTYTRPYNRTATDDTNGIANPFLVIDNGGTARIDGTSTAPVQGSSVNLGFREADPSIPRPIAEGHLIIDGITNGDVTVTLGEMRVGGRETIPPYVAPFSLDNLPNAGGIGSVIQKGGTVNITYRDPENLEPPIQSLYIGDAGRTAINSPTRPTNTARGSYTISAGTLNVGVANDDAIVIGTGFSSEMVTNPADPTGPLIEVPIVQSFTQSVADGVSAVSTTGFVIVGRRGATGSYSLSGGTLSAGSTAVGIRVGDGEGDTRTRGSLTMSAGTLTTAGPLEIGYRSGTGAVTFTGGTMNVGSWVTGAGGSTTDASLLHGRGTFTMNETTGTSVLNITGNSNTGVTTTTLATVGGDSTGTVNMSAGKITMSGASAIWGVGNGPGASGTVNLSGGTIEMTGTGTTAPLLDIGRNTGVTGIVNVLGTGKLNVKEILINAAHNAASGYPNGERKLNISGSADVDATLVWYGNVRNLLDVREVNVSGGTADFGIYRTGNPGVLNVSGTGVVTIGTVNDAGGTQNGTVNVTGGTLNVTGAYNTHRGTLPAGATPSLNISNGTVSIGSLNVTDGALLNITGGSVTIPTLTLSTGGTLRTENTQTLGSSTLMGNATVNVVNGSLTLTGKLRSDGAGGRTLSKTGAGTLNVNGVQEHVVTGSAITNASGGGVVNLNANGGAFLGVNANSGTFNFGAPQDLRQITVNNGATLNVNANNVTTTDVLTLNNGAISGTGTVTSLGYVVQTGSISPALAGAGTLTTTASATTVTLSGNNTYSGGSTISAGTVIAAHPNAFGTGPLSVANGAKAQLQANLPSPVAVHSVSSTGTGALDITDNDVVIEEMDGTSVRNLLLSGFNSGAWNGGGINDSLAATDFASGAKVLAIGYIPVADLPPGTTAFKSFTGLDNTDVLLKHTYYGDADLGGTVDLDDFTQLLAGLAGDGTGWLYGDFDYNGNIDLDDFTQFLAGFNFNGSPLSEVEQAVLNANLTQAVETAMLSAIAAVPEPSGLAVLAIAACGFAVRRRRTNR